jgi:pimeloyl-ACP methyl ester carboxylesterase
VLIHGWPLNGDAWEKQTTALLAAGHRVITYDRRGFGRSSKPAIGYNYNTFAADLDALLSALDLTGVSFVGHSMGTGEITRYIGKYGTKRLRKTVLIGTLGPYLVKAPDNPEGVDRKVFDDTIAGLKADRPATLMEFLKNFYSVGGEDGKRVSERVIAANWAVGIAASPIGTTACVDSWIEDFRKDIPRNDLPTMIIHGGRNRETTGQDDQGREICGAQGSLPRSDLDACGRDQRRARALPGLVASHTTDKRLGRIEIIGDPHDCQSHSRSCRRLGTIRIGKQSVAAPVPAHCCSHGRRPDAGSPPALGRSCCRSSGR